MLFDAPAPTPDKDGLLLHWFLRGGLVGILLLCSLPLFPSMPERLQHALCPLTNPDVAFDLGVPFSAGGAILLVVLILVSQFVIYGAIGWGLGLVALKVRNLSSRPSADPGPEK